MARIIQFRRHTAQEWQEKNPILLESEIGYEKGTGMIKIGDGLLRWNELEPFRTQLSDEYIYILENINDVIFNYLMGDFEFIPDQTINPSEPYGGNLGDILDWIVNRINKIIGKDNWWDDPEASINQLIDSLDDHIQDMDNPHQVTKDHVDLGKADNMSADEIRMAYQKGFSVEVRETDPEDPKIGQMWLIIGDEPDDPIIEPSSFKYIGSGRDAFVAIKDDDTLAAWGANHSNQISDTPQTQQFIQVDGGYDWFAGLKSDNTLMYWGTNNSFVTTPLPSDNILEFSCSPFGLLAVKLDGTLTFGGTGSSGQYTNIPTGGNYIKVSSSDGLSAALKNDNTLTIWGNDDHGQIANAPQGYTFMEIITNGSYVIGLRTDGTLAAWGQDNYNQVSNIPEGNTFIQISSGFDHSAALRSDGTLVVWGRDNHGQISNAPQENDFIKVTCGGNSCVAIKTDGTLVAWGMDNHGQVSNLP